MSKRLAYWQHAGKDWQVIEDAFGNPRVRVQVQGDWLCPEANAAVSALIVLVRDLAALAATLR